MKTALTVIFIIASILLIILVLMQEGKEAGLGSLTGAADSGTYWSKNKGRSKEGTLIKVTTFFTIVFFVTNRLTVNSCFFYTSTAFAYRTKMVCRREFP